MIGMKPSGSELGGFIFPLPMAYDGISGGDQPSNFNPIPDNEINRGRAFITVYPHPIRNVPPQSIPV
jgi:hypothetical protein